VGDDLYLVERTTDDGRTIWLAEFHATELELVDRPPQPGRDGDASRVSSLALAGLATVGPAGSGPGQNGVAGRRNPEGGQVVCSRCPLRAARTRRA
jgi:hypothetical protein